jgi:hypothetical protein
MPPKSFPPDTLDQAGMVLAACKQIDPTLKAGSLTQDAFGDLINRTQAIQGHINDLELQLMNLRNRRDAQTASIWDIVKRVRATVKGMYGDDSSEYELVGGTRMSDRRKTSRRAASDTTSL